MRVFFFDTETTGFVDRKKALDHPSQPGIVQLAYIVKDGPTIVEQFCSLVRTNKKVSAGAEAVTGISNQIANKGMDLSTALNAFYSAACSCESLVAHNTDFDLQIIEVATLENNKNEIDRQAFKEVPAYCTMKTTTPLLKLPGPYGYKWPKLIEAYKILVDPKGFEGAHDALIDVKALMDVYTVLAAKGIRFSEVNHV